MEEREKGGEPWSKPSDGLGAHASCLSTPGSAHTVHSDLHKARSGDGAGPPQKFGRAPRHVVGVCRVIEEHGGHGSTIGAIRGRSLAHSRLFAPLL